MATKRIIDVLEALEHDSDESDVEIEYSDSECEEEVVEESEHDSRFDCEFNVFLLVWCFLVPITAFVFAVCYLISHQPAILPQLLAALW